MSIHICIDIYKCNLPHNHFPSLHNVEEICDEGSIRLINQQTRYASWNEYVEVTSGVLEVCVNGTYLRMCNSSRVDEALADTVCYYLGYDGQLGALHYVCMLNNT